MQYHRAPFPTSQCLAVKLSSGEANAGSTGGARAVDQTPDTSLEPQVWALGRKGPHLPTYLTPPRGAGRGGGGPALKNLRAPWCSGLRRAAGGSSAVLPYLATRLLGLDGSWDRSRAGEEGKAGFAGQRRALFREQAVQARPRLHRSSLHHSPLADRPAEVWGGGTLLAIFPEL